MKVCITCQADVSGKRAVPIREDRIIKTIRAVKRALGVAQNNELFVCDTCIPKHMERRRSFEKTMLFASIFAGFVILLLFYSIVTSGRLDAWAIASAFVVAGFVLLLPIFRYAPAIEQVGAPQTSMPAWSASAPVPKKPKEKGPEQELSTKGAPKAKRRR